MPREPYCDATIKRAVASPMPLPAPVTIATLPSRRPIDRKYVTALDSVDDGGRRPVLLVGAVRAPRRAVPFLVDLHHREVGHEPRPCRAVPVFFAGLEEHAVAGPDHLDRAATPLRETDALEDIDRLAVRVRVPRGACSGREVDAARTQARSA